MLLVKRVYVNLVVYSGRQLSFWSFSTMDRSNCLSNVAYHRKTNLVFFTLFSLQSVSLLYNQCTKRDKQNKTGRMLKGMVQFLTCFSLPQAKASKM